MCCSTTREPGGARDLRPRSTLQGILMTKEDYDDIRRRMPFVLTTDEIPEYQILYIGKQRIDELGPTCSMSPKQIEKNKRYFQGRIWVDDADFQIVKTYARMFPTSEPRKRAGRRTVSQLHYLARPLDGKYWFPVYTKVDDTLHFSSGDIHIKQIVKYTDYKRFGAKSKITYEGQEISKDQPATTPPSSQPPASTHAKQ